MTTKQTSPAIDAFLCFALYSTSLSMTQRYKPMLEALNLTYPQYLVILVLLHEDGLGIKDIAERLHQDPGSITPMVKRLEVQGYVTRKRDTRDERNVIVSLTDAGKALYAESCNIRASIASACGSSEPEMAELIDAILKLRTRLEQ